MVQDVPPRLPGSPWPKMIVPSVLTLTCAQHDISLRFRGSSNQRIIDLNATRAAGHTVLWQDDPLFADHKM